jgi:hypothetical protein
MKQTKEGAETLLTLEEFDQFKFERIIPVSEVGIDKALIAYWRREGLLPFVEKGKWAKVSCVEAIWLMMLDSLRSFGVSTEVMNKMAHYFYERAYHDDLPKRNLLYNKDKLERLKTARALTKQEAFVLQDIEEKLKTPALLHALKWDVNYLSNLITESIRSKSEAAVLVFADGTIAQQVYGAMTSLPGNIIDYSKPHITLSLQYFFQQFIDSEHLSQFLLLTHVYNEDEERVLREMRNKNVHTISIKMKKGKPWCIDSEKNGEITGEEAREIRRFLGLKNYESITLNTRDEKTLTFKKTKKQINK